MIVTRTPLSTLINIEHALVSELFGALSEEMPHISNTNLKALFVAYERKRREGRKGEGEKGEEEGRRGEGMKGQEEGRRGEGEKGEKGEQVGERRNGEELEEKVPVAEEGGKGERSFWKPFLDALPDVLHTTHFFSEEELEQLQISMVTMTTDM